MVKHKSILLVDDEENLVTGLKRQLRGQFDIFTATSGQEALDIISNHEEFAVVVSDMRMPGDLPPLTGPV
jgi:CheY-like chemotaxis protein